MDRTRTKVLQVRYNGRTVGRLALYKDRLGAFEYEPDWIADGFSISPFSLPLRKQVFIPGIDPFEGLFGVFMDSLPDGWGRLLTDRLLLKNHINPHEYGNLDRLAIVGDSGMGALTYHPETRLEGPTGEMDLDDIAAECRRLLEEKSVDRLDDLFRQGGSSGGARPKILTTIDGEDWIIKFPASGEPLDIGLQEYNYSLCARECGVEMAETRLYPSARCDGYFGVKRFDRTRINGRPHRIHMISASALLETSHRIPNLDYDLLMRLTLQLTDSMEECEKLFRLMCFNVYSHNRDDHSKNFSYLFLEDERRWVLSPAYDLTYSSSLGGEHATTVHGNGRNPSTEDILAVASGIGISPRTARRIAEYVRECVNELLFQYL